MSRIVDVPCSASDDKGKQKARKLLLAWRKELEEDELNQREAEARQIRFGKRPIPTLGECITEYVEVRLPNKRYIEASTKAGYRRRASYILRTSIAKNRLIS